MAISQEVLDIFGFFGSAPESLRREAAKTGQLVPLGKGDFFYHQGDSLAHFALVVSGDIRVYKTSESGREITLYHVQKGQTCMVNLLCILLERESPASAQAESEVSALVFPGETVRQWISNHEGFRDYLFASMSSRLVDVMTLLEEVTFAKMDQRLAEYLLDTFLPPKSPAVKMVQMTHQHIADELGSAREVVSRLLGELQRMGAITLGRGEIGLADGSKLRELAGRS